MKRFVDQNYGSETHFEIIDNGVCVVCPKCQGMGIVKGEREDGKYYCKNIRFKCTSCYDSQMYNPIKYNYQANAVCSNCEHYLKNEIEEVHKGHNILNITCSYCETVVPAKMQKIEKERYTYAYANGINVNGISATEPCFGYELYFLFSFKGKAVFARNRTHLQYLIDYIEADLRVKETPLGGMMRRVPSFMKLAENRADILKILKRLQQK